MLASTNTSDKQEQRKEEQFFEMVSGLGKYCSFLTNNKWESDDLCQTSVCKALQHYSKDDITAPLLKKIAYHQWIDTVRSRKHEVIGVPEKDEKHDSLSHSGPQPDAVNLLLEKLTPKQAVIFTLKEAFRYQANEIAEILDIPETAVKSLLHRARKRLDSDLRPLSESWDQEEREYLEELLHQSLLYEDPAILIRRLPDIPSFVDVRRSSSPLSFTCMAA